MRFRNLGNDGLLSAAMAATRRRLLAPLLRSAADPREVQARVLGRICASNAATDFGRDKGFSSVKSMADWRAALPVQTYEDLRPWIDRQAETGEPALTAERPVMYTQTSGTTSRPKLIPITHSGMRRFKRQQRLFASVLHAFDKRLYGGRIFGVSSPAVEGHLANGLPFGSVSGMVYRDAPRAVRTRQAIPPKVFEIADYDTRYWVIAMLMLATPDVTLAATANPSTLVRLLRLIEENLDGLLAAVETGRLPASAALSPATTKDVIDGIRPSPSRAGSLARIAEKQGSLGLSDIWPDLRGITTWTGGSCGLALESLRRRMAEDVSVVEFGYAASEFRGTINLDPRCNLCLPTFNENLFEFVEQQAWEQGDLRFQGLEEIEEGGRYYIFTTTPDGLYRYHINDIVEVSGRIGRTPTLAFIHKGQGVTSITGEKVHEQQMDDAVRTAGATTGTQPAFFVALADEAAAIYRVHVEMDGTAPIDCTAFAQAVDDRLCSANLEYKAKRLSGRLQAAEIIVLLPGTAEAYRRHAVARGQRAAQFKILPLAYARGHAFDFSPWVTSQATS